MRRILRIGGMGALYLYEHGAVNTRIPLEELRERADVTALVNENLSEVEFSSQIREGVPVPR